MKTDTKRRPSWLKTKIPSGKNYVDLKNLLHARNIHTVCEEALCPNVADCWSRKTATLMILGDVCTRSCGFCAVTTGRPSAANTHEPEQVAETVQLMALDYVVITSVDRDELPDCGAGIWAETIRSICNKTPHCRIEVLTPDFKGRTDLIQAVLDAGPHIFGHNLETVPQLYRTVRPQGNYHRSLDLLHYVHNHGALTKTGIMVGLGETRDQVNRVMKDARNHGVDIFTVGQYLQPTRKNLPVHRFVHPDEFEEYRIAGLDMGFRMVQSAPLVRSSYHAEENAPGDLTEKPRSSH